MKRIIFLYISVVSCLAAVALTLAFWPSAVAGVAAPAGAGAKAMAQLQVALQRAVQAEVTTAIPGEPVPAAFAWKNPYAPVQALLRKDASLLPRIWQARALGREAAYLHSVSYGCKPTTAKRFRTKARRLLLRAVKIAPGYSNGWVMLAWQRIGTVAPDWDKTSDAYLLRAYRADPSNPCVEYLRAFAIWRQYGARWEPSGIFKGDLGFKSQKWIRAFCYRALMFFKYQNLHISSIYLPVSAPASVPWWLSTGLKYYDPQEFAALDAGTWEPGPCPDPWPPAMRKPSQAASEEK
jgi:hypothetical protein